MVATSSAGRKSVNLALQGGGAHGAFTWGVIDGLLEDGRIEIEGISGTSAGAVNACLLMSGLARSGPEEARKALADFWRRASLDGHLPDAQRAIVDRLFSFFPLADTPWRAWAGVVSRFLSPYDLNPLNINPLKDLVEAHVDFEAIRACRKHHLFVSATNVHTGRLRIFPREKVTADVVMASACLPLVFRSVEIDGTPYWDGGFMGNPAIFPFFRATRTEDVLLVQINPVERKEKPTSSQEIMNRQNEITFNAPLLGELRAIDFVTRLIGQGRLPHGTGPGEYRDIKMHRIALDGAALGIDASSKTDTDYDFFLALRDAGRRAASDFLARHFDDLGQCHTFDLAHEVGAEWA